MADGDPRAEATVRSLEQGGLPVAAQERLDALRAQGGRFFTSNLAASELAALAPSGFRPLTQVMGSCFYNIGWQWLPGSGYGTTGWSTPYQEGQTVELETQTEAWNEARRLAVGRLREEAVRAGADAVVGVRLRRGTFDWASGLLEFVAVGTAVVSRRYDLGPEPVLSNLTGQEFTALFEHGYWPVGLLAATTVGYVMSGWTQRSNTTGWRSGRQNQELPDFTNGLSETRAQTVLQLRRQAHEVQAHGIVGVQLDQSMEDYEREINHTSYRDLIVTVHATGTAIVELERRGEAPPVYIALPLDEE